MLAPLAGRLPLAVLWVVLLGLERTAVEPFCKPNASKLALIVLKLGVTTWGSGDTEVRMSRPSNSSGQWTSRLRRPVRKSNGNESSCSSWFVLQVVVLLDVVTEELYCFRFCILAQITTGASLSAGGMNNQYLAMMVVQAEVMMRCSND